MADNVVKIGGHDLSVMELPDGSKCFRLNPDDIELVECCMVDNIGRLQPVRVPSSTVLIMVVVGAIGALPFDRMQQDGPHGIMNVVDEDGRQMFAQRPGIHRDEIFNIAQTVVEKERVNIQRAKMSDVARFGGGR